MSLTQHFPAYLTEVNGQSLINVAIAFDILETLFFILFLCGRAIAKTMNGLDFWLIPVAYLACFSHVIAISSWRKVWVAYKSGVNHSMVITPAGIEMELKIMFSEYFLYTLSAALPKLTILSLYLRIFTQRRYRYATYANAIILILNWLTACIMGIVICKPIQYNSNRTIPGGHCGDIMSLFRWSGLPNLITDIVMIILPLPMVLKLQLPRSQKAGLALTFIIGGIGTISSAVRFVSFCKVDMFTHSDLYNATGLAWTCVEPGVYFIAATLLSLRPLVLKICKEADFSTLLTLHPLRKIVESRQRAKETQLVIVENIQLDSTVDHGKTSGGRRSIDLEATGI
ncbi:MAG: hypothetical protein Q9212_003776 [Teloschistes hypoglaucus]